MIGGAGWRGACRAGRFEQEVVKSFVCSCMCDVCVVWFCILCAVLCSVEYYMLGCVLLCAVCCVLISVSCIDNLCSIVVFVAWHVSEQVCAHAEV